MNTLKNLKRVKEAFIACMPDDGLDFLKAVATVAAIMFYCECYLPAVGEDNVVCYQWRAQFETMPERDAKLRDWVDFAPGTDPLSTEITRDGSLNVYFGIRQNLLGDPQIPDFATHCARLGYTGIRNISLTRVSPSPPINPHGALDEDIQRLLEPSW